LSKFFENFLPPSWLRTPDFYRVTVPIVTGSIATHGLYLHPRPNGTQLFSSQRQQFSRLRETLLKNWLWSNWSQQ